MGAHPIAQQVKWPKHMCEHCSNVLGPVGVFGNNPDDDKCSGAGMDLKPQWGGKLKGQADDDPTQHAFIDISYSVRDHSDSEKFKKFAMYSKRIEVPMCELGKQLPFVHTKRQMLSEYPEIRMELDMKGVPRILDIDSHTHCSHCGKLKTYQGYADYSWRSTLSTCTNPECIMNGGDDEIFPKSKSVERK